MKWRGFERILWPLLNVMQSLPHFSYLIPVAVFIGVGHKAGTIATILFAMPPMARLTILGLRGVSPEIVEAGLMAGCTRLQMLHKVEIPAARPTIMVGVNQVIMQCLAMVVIASFIGAKGLGHDLLFRLQSLRIGQALEIGVAIVFMAVALDRLSQALAAKEPVHLREGAWWRVHPFLGAAAAVVALTAAASFVTPHASVFPKELTLTTAPFWDGIVDWVTVHLFDPLNLFRDALLLHVLIPMRTGYQAVPWLAVAVLVGGIGWHLGRARIALPVLGFLAFIMLSGFWARSQITAYMVSFSVLACVAIGLPLGIWASKREWRTKLVQLLCDTFQTFPSFIYLIPVIMLFKVGDVAAISAIVIYASIPAVRYTMIGLRSVPGHIIEAATTSGCTPRQILWKVRMPARVPGDHAGGQPDHHVRAVHGDHRRLHRDAGPGPGDLPRADVQRRGQGAGGGAVRRLHRPDRGSPHHRVGGGAQARAGDRVRRRAGPPDHARVQGGGSGSPRLVPRQFVPHMPGSARHHVRQLPKEEIESVQSRGAPPPSC